MCRKKAKDPTEPLTKLKKKKKKKFNMKVGRAFNIFATSARHDIKYDFIYIDNKKIIFI